MRFAVASVRSGSPTDASVTAICPVIDRSSGTSAPLTCRLAVARPAMRVRTGKNGWNVASSMPPSASVESMLDGSRPSRPRASMVVPSRRRGAQREAGGTARGPREVAQRQPRSADVDLGRRAHARVDDGHGAVLDEAPADAELRARRRGTGGRRRRRGRRRADSPRRARARSAPRGRARHERVQDGELARDAVDQRPRLLDAQPIDAHRRRPRVVEPGDLGVRRGEESSLAVGHGQVGERGRPPGGEGHRLEGRTHLQLGGRLAGDATAQRQVGANGRDVDTLGGDVELEARAGGGDLAARAHRPAARHGDAHLDGRRPARRPGDVPRDEPDPAHLDARGRAHRGVAQDERAVLEHASRTDRSRGGAAADGAPAPRSPPARGPAEASARTADAAGAAPAGADSRARSGSVPSRRRSTIARGP